MSVFKDFSAHFAQSVCLLTSKDGSGEKTCTISSYNSVSSSLDSDLFSFSLSSNSYMAGVVKETSHVRVCLLGSNQSNAANFFVKNRVSNAEFELSKIVSTSIGFAEGEVTSRINVGASTLYIVAVHNIEIMNANLTPLVYRLRQYQSP